MGEDSWSMQIKQIKEGSITVSKFRSKFIIIDIEDKNSLSSFVISADEAINMGNFLIGLGRDMTEGRSDHDL